MDIAQQLGEADTPHEMFTAFFISSRREIAGAYRSVGDSGSITMQADSIIEQAQYFAAREILLIHTHPSGDPRPSHQDIATTRRLYSCLKPYNIRLYDHIILCSDRYFSFRHNGML